MIKRKTFLTEFFLISHYYLFYIIHVLTFVGDDDDDYVCAAVGSSIYNLHIIYSFGEHGIVIFFSNFQNPIFIRFASY